jgi:CheY-like chemotaxis protein
MQTRAPGTEHLPQGGAHGPTVLLVDDEVDIRHLARLQLQRLGGFEVVGEASDGQEAIELARELQPGLVLLDVMMPRVDGFEAIPELLRVSPRSMIVMLTALHRSEHEQSSLAAGAFAYLEKTEISREFHATLLELYTRFQRALAGETVWAPERPPG